MQDPGRTFPRAMLYAVVMVVLAYLVPLMVGIGASSSDWREWDDGYFATVGRDVVNGRWLSGWIVAAAAVSNVSLYCAEMGSDR